MSQSAQSYILSHGLVRKYGLGIVLVLLAGIGSALMGDTPALITLKVLAAVPFAVASIVLPAIFNPERSRTPFTPSYIERLLLESVLLAIAITILSWQPDHVPLRTISVLLVTGLVYFFAQCALASFRRR